MRGDYESCLTFRIPCHIGDSWPMTLELSRRACFVNILRKETNAFHVNVPLERAICYHLASKAVWLFLIIVSSLSGSRLSI